MNRLALAWPGDGLAGDTCSDAALLRAMVSLEAAWLDALVAGGIAPPEAGGTRETLEGAVDADHVDALAAEVANGSESGGNPVIPLLDRLRDHLGRERPDAARWLHRGLTSQDTLDSALMLCSRDALTRVGADLDAQRAELARLAREHRDTAMVARTLTQHAVPTTFGAKVASWSSGVVAAAEDITALVLPIQIGGAAGTLAGPLELARDRGLADPATAVRDLVARTATSLGLTARRPWHTDRSPVTRIGDALLRSTDAWGRIANDVLVLSRPEIGEMSEPIAEGRGASSTMPQKVNPVLSVLIRRAALAAPALGATLHLAAAQNIDERADGAWHVEWDALLTLGRRTVVAGAQTRELLAGLQAHPERMRATLDRAVPGVLSEQRSMAELCGAEPISDPIRYLGIAVDLADEAGR